MPRRLEDDATTEAVTKHRVASIETREEAVVQGPVQYLDTLQKLYFWENKTDVRRMLIAHPETQRALVQAAARVPRYFGSNTRLALRVAPEVDGDGSAGLFAYIHTDRAPSQALDNLQQFDEDWWLDTMQHLSGVLTFTLRFG